MERFTRSLMEYSHISSPNQTILHRIASSYSSAMIVACDSGVLSYDLYMKVRCLPETFTRLQIKSSYDINVNGDANLDNPNLLTATDKHGKQLIVKVLKISDDPRLTLEDRKSLVADEVQSFGFCQDVSHRSDA